MTGPTDTYLGLRAFVDELARSGLQHCATSPGSRSTPLVLSLVRDGRVRCWSHLDERCGGFFALGAAKAAGRPAAMVCTSGTAAANYLPAVVEAYESRVPLLVLTTDRPPELRDVGAGQTIDQVKLFGRNATWFLEVDEAAATPERMRFMRRLACQAWLTAVENSRPVHLNFALREPLVLDGPLPAEEPGGGGRPDGRPWIARRPATPRSEAATLLAELRDRPRAVVVAGRLDEGAGKAVARLCHELGIPLLAEPTSGARTGEAIAHYDLTLRHPAAELAPDLVVRVGDLPASKPLRQWLAGLPAARQIGLGAGWQDPAGTVDELLDADPAATAVEALELRGGDGRSAAIGAPAGWLDAWRDADRRARVVIGRLAGEGTEPGTAARVWEALPADALLLVASSMPIRDLELAAYARADPPRVLANRGANGIDGLVSTAYGIAAASPGRPVALLIGDVALAYDIGGLLAGRRLGLALTIVVVNNDGGGIFHFLPVAGQSDAFEEHVATPHGLDFARAAELYGARHERPAEVAAAVRRALGTAGTTILEVVTDRRANRELHRQIAEAVRLR